MVSQEMYLFGSKRSCIRELYEHGCAQAKLVGADNVFDFSLGNPSVPAPDAVGDAFLECLSALPPIVSHGYTTAAGCLEARAAIASSLNRRFQTNFTPKNLYLTCGAAAALTSCFKALTVSSETEFVAIAPFFPEYRCFSAVAGAKLTVVPADEIGFQIDFTALEKALNPHTQGVVVNSPNNPSGACFSEETVIKLAELLHAKSAEFGHPIYLISDEPYREIYYETTPLPFLTKYYDNTIVCYSYSKSLSLPGERIGYLLVPDETENAERVYAALAGSARSMGYVCAPSIVQQVIARCADVMPDLTVYRRNRDLLYEAFTKLNCRMAKPSGAFYLFLEAPNGDGDAFSELAKKENVLIVPGRDFGCASFVRISYCVDTRVIERALPILEKLVKSCRK